jgi:hypothetical protein
LSEASGLIEELIGIGATIEATGNGLIPRAGPLPIPSQLVRRVKHAKSDLIAVLRTKSLETRIVSWLDHHPVPSPPGWCAWCGKRDRPEAIVLPFGTEAGKHTWLHAECWSPWHDARRANAVSALDERG